jgi:hypothetical protein
MTSMPAPADGVIVKYAVPRTRPEWALSDELVPESQPHDQTLDLLKAILFAWVARTEKCAAAGVEELWMFDAHLVGPRLGGGPHRLQLWRRSAEGFARVYASDGPVHSPYLDAWVFAVNEGRRLRIADDEAGTSWWLTAEERERAEKDQLRARLVELEAQLAERGRAQG